MKLYGSLINRIEEDRTFCDEIKVGTGMTEYHWSDRDAYEVVAVKDQKHVTVREYDHRNTGNGFDNSWELISNPDNPLRDLVKIGNYWYWTNTLTLEDLNWIEKDDPCVYISVCVNWDVDKIRAKGKQTKRTRAKVSFGKADYYYDHSF